MSTEFREFDRKTCPFCKCVIDMHKDFYSEPALRHGVCLFKCHACGTLYEAVPVISSWRAHVLVRGEALHSKQNA